MAPAQSALVAVCVVVAVVVVVGGSSAPAKSPPPFPFSFWQTWTTMTETWVNSAGNSSEQWSYGFHSIVNNASNGTLCRTGIDLLFPSIPNYTSIVVSNYTSGVETRRDMDYNGSVSDCESKTLTVETMPLGGDWFLSPSSTVFSQMYFNNYAMAGGNNCSVYEWVGPDAFGNKQVLQWFVALESNIPQVYVNQTFYTTPFKDNWVSRIVTTAFTGYEQMYQWPDVCTAPNICGTQFCAANQAVGNAALQSALSWVCGGYVDCDDISYGGPNYYPNTIVTHASWAFNQYYLANIDDGTSACNFNGAALLTTCETGCTLCNASDLADPVKLERALSWVCANGNIDCSAIQPGGQRFYPNTTMNHANYAFNEYYQGWKCIPPQSQACDFNGTAIVVPCHV